MNTTAYVFFFIIFGFVPITTIILLFFKDNDLKRKKSINIKLIGNTLLFLFPILYVFISTFPKFDMGENGPGAILWLYLLILPFSIIWQIILISSKIKHYKKSK